MPEINDSELVEAAIKASEHAYMPYSNYRVGAALLTADGQVYGGCNIESVSFTPTTCAERTALFKAVSEGHREFAAIAVVTRDAGSPCGVCRQMMFEFAPEMRVILADLEGRVQLTTTLDALLPHGFGPSNLNDAS